MASGNFTTVDYNRYFITNLNIGSSCYNLNGFTSYIYLTYNQFVCIRMSFNFFNLAYYDFFQIFV